MKLGYVVAVLAAGFLLAVMPSVALGGVQTTTCGPGPQPGQVSYTFFGCTPNIHADELRIVLNPMEITQGETIVGCTVPAIAGMSCSFTPTVATFLFPVIGPFQCVPATPGDIEKFGTTIATTDGTTLVDEQWFLNGAQVAGFVSVIACPSVSVEGETWGRIKSIYR